MVAMGTNFFGPISDTIPYQGLLGLIGFLYFLGIYHRNFIKLVQIRLYLVWLIGLIMPLILMFESEKEFLRSDYTSLISVLFVFVTSTLIATDRKNGNVVVFSALTIGLISISLNFYEFFVENNVWSTAPGRSAGFYLNPNRSAQAILIFAAVYLTWNKRELSVFDYFFIALILLATLVTFSRGGIVVSILVFAFLFFLKYKVKWKTIASLLFISGFLIFLSNLVLSSYLEDGAYYRLTSLRNGEIQVDFEDEREIIALESYYLALKSPIFGTGVGSTKLLDVGAHNTFISIFLDYGLLGILFYLFTIMGIVVAVFKKDNKEIIFLKLFLVWFLSYNFLTHNMLEDSVLILGFGLAVSRMLYFRVNSADA